MADIDLSDFASIDPKQFAQLVKSASNDQLAAAIAGDMREKVLGEIFGRMPSLFRADRAGTTNAVIHWTIADGPDGVATPTSWSSPTAPACSRRRRRTSRSSP